MEAIAEAVAAAEAVEVHPPEVAEVAAEDTVLADKHESDHIIEGGQTVTLYIYICTRVMY